MKLKDWKTVAEDWKAFIEVVGTILGWLALLFGGGFAICQYLEKNKADRIKESLVFVERFQKAPIYDKWERIASTWRNHEEEMNDLLKIPGVTEQWNSFVLTTIKEEQIEGDVFAIIDFFRLVHVCARSEICDADTINEFFGSEVRTFFRLHYPFISYNRETRKNPSHAKELEEFVASLPR
ncbi:hypothetical protein [Nitrosospira sp. NRS527]|uniref:DUF4760 domain-containing protein n=1 Tax=Nitrosospira sp. NRS527 TaxID=155925 RepID=UPI001AF3DE34|nr:hypothetical protein [Nitrosospira sp. NRS527]BCT69252.1 hypothetical protein NNRS527_02867 [Nitrosospira sp. NRS527]